MTGIMVESDPFHKTKTMANARIRKTVVRMCTGNYCQSLNAIRVTCYNNVFLFTICCAVSAYHAGITLAQNNPNFKPL